MAAVTPSIPPILLVRLTTGAGVRESRRVCHLVPVPDAADVPQEMLRAYCGERIPPGAAEAFHTMVGMPCEPCLGKLPIPAFALLRLLPAATSDGVDDGVGWWDFGLRQDEKVTARFVLLLLLQDPSRYLSVAEIADRLDQEDSGLRVNLIMLVHASVGWVERAPDQDNLPWAACSYRLTERGADLARRLLRKELTPTFAAMAGGLGVGITVLFERHPRGIESSSDTESGQDTTDPGGCSGRPDDAAPAGNHPSAHEATPNPAVDEETS